MLLDAEIASRGAIAPQVVHRSGANGYFCRSLRISFRAPGLLRVDWTSASRTTPLALGVDGEAASHLES
jgi:hypothetical protein